MLYHKPVIVDEDLWVSSAVDNGLYKINPNNSKCEFIRLFPNEKFKSGYIHSSAVKYESELFFIPFAGRYISSYNLDDGVTKCFGLKHYSDDMNSLFYNCVVEGEYLYLVPCRYEYIVEFNMKTSEIQEYKAFDRKGQDSKDIEPFVLKGGCIGEGKLYIGENQKNRIVEFDITTKEISRHEIEFELSGISNLEYINGELWVFGKNGTILYGDIKRGDFNVLEGIEISNAGHFGVFFESVVVGTDIYVSKSTERVVYRINTKEKVVRAIIKFSDFDKKSDFCPFDIFTLYVTDNELRALDSVSGETYRYDFELDRINEQTFTPITDEIIDYSKYKGNAEGTNIGEAERNGLELSSFLQCLREGQYAQCFTYEGRDGKGVIINEGQ